MSSATLFMLFVSLAAEDLLSRSIGYHDPDGSWERGSFQIVVGESRPDGTERNTRLRFDNARGRFEMERTLDDGRSMRAVVVGDEVEVRLDGSTEFTAEEAERFRLGSDQIARTRNYYLYLYGLPMKIRDPGTRLDPEAVESDFLGTPAYELRVTYDESVGSDTWYFYLDRDTYALIGYRFYHDETARDGEYIVLTEEASGAGLTLPRVRKWYRHQDDGFLGTDTIRSIGPP